MQLLRMGGFGLFSLVFFMQIATAGDKVCLPPPHECAANVTEVKLAETQDLIAIPQLSVREVLTEVPVMGIDVQYKEEKRCVTVMVLKPREVTREVSSVSMVPQTTVDPCTGQCCTTYKAVTRCKTVKETVFDTVPETKEYMVKVPVLTPVERAVTVKTLAVDATTTAARMTRLSAAITPSVVHYPAPPCLNIPPVDISCPPVCPTIKPAE